MDCWIENIPFPESFVGGDQGLRIPDDSIRLLHLELGYILRVRDRAKAQGKKEIKESGLWFHIILYNLSNSKKLCGWFRQHLFYRVRRKIVAEVGAI